MGNHLSAIPVDTSSKWEYLNGKRLISAVAMNSREATNNAIEYARKECVKPHGIHASVMEYEDMVTTMIEYLTRKYYCGEAMISMTPLAYAESLTATEAADCITSALRGFETAKNNADKAMSGGESKSAKDILRQRQMDREYEKMGFGPAAPPPEPLKKVVIGEVTKERAQDAKARLIAFRATKNDRK